MMMALQKIILTTSLQASKPLFSKVKEYDQKRNGVYTVFLKSEDPTRS